MRDKNKYNLTKEEYRKVIKEIRNIEGLIIERADLNQLVFPPVSKPLISVLQELRIDGLKYQLRDKYYKLCQFISYYQNQIKKYYRDKYR